MYVALAYHYHVDWPWEEVEPDYWVMDYLSESLEQLKEIETKIEDEYTKEIYEDMCRIIKKAIDSEKSVLLRVV